MNEFELQSVVMTAKAVKSSDKFAMLCILKAVDWNTWKGTVTLSYISKKYDINRRTLSRTVKRLKDLDWISVYTKDDETIINVKISNITSKNTLDKMSIETRQNDHEVLDKMSIETRQNDHEALDKMSIETRQNVYHNNIINNNTIYNNTDNHRSEYQKLYLELYGVDIDKPRSYLSEDDLKFIVDNNIKPTWKKLDQYSHQELKEELSNRATCLNLPTAHFSKFVKAEKKREL